MIEPGQVVVGFGDAARVRVGPGELARPAAVVERLAEAFRHRRPVLVELAVEAAELQAPEACLLAPWEAGADVVLGRERLAHLVWANNWDLRGGRTVWWWAVKAARLLPGATVGGPADVVVDGIPVIVDGGPRGDVVTVGSWPVWHRQHVEAGLTGWERDGPVVVALFDVDHAVAPEADALAPDQQAAVTAGLGGRRGSSPRPARARHACSPPACATWSNSGGSTAPW